MGSKGKAFEPDLRENGFLGDLGGGTVGERNTDVSPRGVLESCSFPWPGRLGILLDSVSPGLLGGWFPTAGLEEGVMDVSKNIQISHRELS